LTIKWRTRASYNPITSHLRHERSKEWRAGEYRPAATTPSVRASSSASPAISSNIHRCVCAVRPTLAARPKGRRTSGDGRASPALRPLAPSPLSHGGRLVLCGQPIHLDFRISFRSACMYGSMYGSIVLSLGNSDMSHSDDPKSSEAMSRQRHITMVLATFHKMTMECDMLRVRSQLPAMLDRAHSYTTVYQPPPSLCAVRGSDARALTLGRQV
jgi:hypothetical protein